MNPRDYRAWYGLGQTYELLAMPHYALHYYRRASLLRPADARMWCAMAQCYACDELALHEAAISCYLRAVEHGDREGIALHQLVGCWVGSVGGCTGVGAGCCSVELFSNERSFGSELDNRNPPALLVGDEFFWYWVPMYVCAQ